MIHQNCQARSSRLVVVRAPPHPKVFENQNLYLKYSELTSENCDMAGLGSVSILISPIKSCKLPYTIKYFVLFKYRIIHIDFITRHEIIFSSQVVSFNLIVEVVYHCQAHLTNKRILKNIQAKIIIQLNQNIL